MIWKLEKKDIGRKVFKAKPGAELKENNCSFGSITSFNEDYAFIKYNGDRKSTAEFPKSLEFVDDFNIRNGTLTRKDNYNGESNTNPKG